MAEIIVTSTAASGTGTLHAAINSASDGDVILFDPTVFPVGQTTRILLTTYLGINKNVAVYGGFADGEGGYTSGVAKEYYVYRNVEGVKTKVVIDDDHPAQEGETVLFAVVPRVALDGQESTRCMYISSNSPTVCGLGFYNGLIASGGCVLTTNTVVLSLVDCDISNCSATSNGGALQGITNSQITATRCSFRSCDATTNGGAICVANTASLILNDCVIDSCSSSANGGGVYGTATSQATINNCIFVDCGATQSGGGVYARDGSQITLTDCRFIRCSTETYDGGGAYCIGTSVNVFTRCSFSDCVATRYGGGMRSILVVSILATRGTAARFIPRRVVKIR